MAARSALPEGQSLPAVSATGATLPLGVSVSRSLATETSRQSREVVLILGCARDTSSQMMFRSLSRVSTRRASTFRLDASPIVFVLSRRQGGRLGVSQSKGRDGETVDGAGPSAIEQSLFDSLPFEPLYFRPVDAEFACGLADRHAVSERIGNPHHLGIGDLGACP
jgi:hypothetical protein